MLLYCIYTGIKGLPNPNSGSSVQLRHGYLDPRTYMYTCKHTETYIHIHGMYICMYTYIYRRVVALAFGGPRDLVTTCNCHSPTYNSLGSLVQASQEDYK